MKDYQILYLILSISGALILILLGIIGYFLKQQINASNALTNAVNGLNTNVIELQTLQDERHPVTERRLNAHAERLDCMEKKIVRIETKLNINYEISKNF